MSWMEDLLTFVLHRNGVEHSPQRRKLNLVGAQLTDDPINGWTTVYIGDMNDWKGSVRAATTADLSATRTGNTLTASGNGNINTLGGIDSITDLDIDDLVLVKNEVSGADNGIWRFVDLGSVSTPWVMQRATLADESVEVTPGLTTYVEEGTVNGRTTWRLRTTSVVLNTTALSWESMVVNPCVSINQADSPYTVKLGQRVVLANPILAPITVLLPPAAEWRYGEIQVKDAAGNASAQTITIDPNGTEQIDGAATYVISTDYRGVTLYSDGSAIRVLNRSS